LARLIQPTALVYLSLQTLEMKISFNRRSP
jgi:hypothetical protein